MLSRTAPGRKQQAAVHELADIVANFTAGADHERQQEACGQSWTRHTCINRPAIGNIYSRADSTPDIKSGIACATARERSIDRPKTSTPIETVLPEQANVALGRWGSDTCVLPAASCSWRRRSAQEAPQRSQNSSCGCSRCSATRKHASARRLSIEQDCNQSRYAGHDGPASQIRRSLQHCIVTMRLCR